MNGSATESQPPTAGAGRRPAVALLEPGQFAGWPSSGDRDQRWLDLLLSRPTERLISNVVTRMALVEVGDALLPITINDAEYENSYVCAAYTGCILYPRSEIAKVRGRLLRAALRGLLRVAGPPLRAARINSAVYVNNWLLSTNLYPALPVDLVPEMTQALVERFPRHAIGLRSLNRETNAALCERLAAAGYLLAPSRQVYLFDGRRSDALKKRDTRQDRRLLKTTSYRVVPHEAFTADDAARIEHLYRLLYIDKYSPHNPQFTAEMIEEFRRRGLLRLWGLRSPAGSLDGVVGSFVRNGVMTVPLVGYDTALPQRLGLYRMLVVLGLEEAAQSGLLLNLSSGAAHFKRLRGGRPCLEYTAVYCRHLAWPRRIAWQTLAMLLERIGAPILEKEQL